MKIGIIGLSGFGGSELLRLILGHPTFELAYAAGSSTAGQRVAQIFPTLEGHKAGEVVIEAFDPARTAGLDLLFASMPTGKSREPLAKVPASVRIVDVGG